MSGALRSRTQNANASLISTTRTIFAFLVAPLAIPFVFVLMALLDWLFSEPDKSVKGGSVLGAFAGLLIFSVYGVVIAYLCELTFGIAAWIVFKRFAIRSLLAFAAGGAVMGWLCYTLTLKRFVDISNPYLRFVDISNPYFWIDLAAGTCCATLFRLVVFSGNQKIKVTL